ncbi:kinesin-like protein KIN-7N isoform X1 [Eucalyptus grandis]|uniref:kinesin-like protein KIN-7N isoform X1 n=1 Tax=Eucalyptus grandis TaxID=71139 RepID=UPI00192E80BC|nr:kinesin-like protein KIN-7N isoform X1 [Eucalyptus grandis]
MEKICVAVRVRPFAAEETFNGTFWKIEDNRISLHRPHGTPVSGLSFAFDHIFGEGCTNATVYDRLTKDVIRAAVEGFNGTAFAYGQTSSGKTFTMNGSDADPGIIRLAVGDVFEKINMMSDREFLIRVSYMEIYNEEINDLLAVENQKLQIHESLERGIFVAGLKEEIVNNEDQVLQLIESGEVNRHFGETNMNARSSRSHTIFRMVIESRAKDISCDNSTSDTIRVSVLNLVDLAGSERIAKTGAGGVRLKEGKHINKSLMVLGNVINKLSEGAKQRGHIPYRDSKLTRILQPALGGNAKTSIICTIAPEEVHVEETKGTLQFASRAKRIINCAQVNEILTDAALLKRQKLEIEELREKLQGSRAEVLEQEILKLRNEMLKYEVEREKLEMELEEERKSHKLREECIKEQQMKIDNLSTLLTCSDCDRNSSQNSAKESLMDEFNDSNSIGQSDFRTPCQKTVPGNYVVKRSNYSQLVECSPLPDPLDNVADEETWFQMNKGFIADLDSIQMTPARKVQSFPPANETPGTDESYRKELEDLRRQLELAVEEKNDLKRKHMEQVRLNKQLIQEVSELQKEAHLIQEIPKRLTESIVNCKDVHSDVVSILQQSFVGDGKSSAGSLLSNTGDIGNILLSTLEAHFSMFMEDHGLCSKDDSSLQEHCRKLCEKLNDTVLLLASKPLSTESEHGRSFSCNLAYKDGDLGGEMAICKENLISGISAIKDKYNGIQKELDESNQLLGVSREKYCRLERDFQLLKEERDLLLQSVSESTSKVSLATDRRENVLRDLNSEVERRKNLEGEIKKFRMAFVGRQNSLASFQSEVRLKLEKMRDGSTVSVPKSLVDL